MLLVLAFLFVFLGVASVDGFYFHIRKYRLHAYPPARYEHLLHTINAVLLVPQLFLLLCVRPQGGWLVAALLLVFVIFFVELLDVLCERDARAALGGLTPLEYAMHFFMGVTRAAYVVAFFARTTPAEYTAPAALLPVAPWQLVLGLCVVVPSVSAAAMYVWLWYAGGREIARAEGGPGDVIRSASL